MRVTIDIAMQSAYDCCIIGAGPAGIILALECQRLRPEERVLLIEFGVEGNPSTNRLDDTIRIANLQNHYVPSECTNKGVGGTSASWGGRCVMYDENDFMQRDILDGQCTWDLEFFRESCKHTDRAARYFECGNGSFNLNEIPSFADSRIAEGFQPGEVTDHIHHKSAWFCHGDVIPEGIELKQKIKGTKHYPFIVEIEPLFACNLSCPGCGKIQHPTDILRKRLSVDDVVRAVEESGTPMSRSPGVSRCCTHRSKRS